MGLANPFKGLQACQPLFKLCGVSVVFRPRCGTPLNQLRGRTLKQFIRTFSRGVVSDYFRNHHNLISQYCQRSISPFPCSILQGVSLGLRGYVSRGLGVVSSTPARVLLSATLSRLSTLLMNFQGQRYKGNLI